MKRLVPALAALLVACNPTPPEASDLRARLDAADVYSPHRDVIGDEARVQLGQMLFFDPELSGNRNIACATCHMPVFHAVDGQPLGIGQGGTGIGPSRRGGPTLPRAVIPPFNRSFVSSFLWDGRVERRADGTIAAPVPLPADVEEPMVAQALMPLLDRDEMRGYAGDLANELAALPDGDSIAIWDAVMARLLAHERYVALFERAFPGETPSITLVGRAIVAFEAQIWDITDTPFDFFLEEDPFDRGLFDDEAHAGAELFFGEAGCARCHRGPLLSDMGFHNIGVPQLGPGKNAEGLDEGRFLVTGDPADRFAFRTPPLRNVELTAPYMHDGAYDTLEEAIEHHAHPEAWLRGYDYAGHPGEARRDPATVEAILATLDPALEAVPDLDPGQIRLLVAFLRSLTSFTEQTIFPEAGVPRELPSGLEPPRPF